MKVGITSFFAPNILFTPHPHYTSFLLIGLKLTYKPFILFHRTNYGHKKNDGFTLEAQSRQSLSEYILS